MTAGVLQKLQEHHIFFFKYEAMHPTAVSENYSLLGMLMISPNIMYWK